MVNRSWPSGSPTPPVPDPTVLTTEQLLREMEGLRRLTDAKLLAADDLNMERFRAVERLLEQSENQRIEQKSDTKLAVDAALAAQKEAVREQTLASGIAISKSETGNANQLQQLRETFTTAVAGMELRLVDVKDRIVQVEATRRGGHETTAALYVVMGLILTFVLVLVALASHVTLK